MLKDVPRKDRKKAKEDVADYLVGQILRNVSKGSSPVKGHGSFKSLNKEYAKKEKGGNRTANLELEGDMLDALDTRIKGNRLEVGIFAKGQQGKADGHNNHTGRSELPLRRFIPVESETFKKPILDGMKRIAKKYKKDRPTPQITTPTRRDRPEPEEPVETTQLTVSDVLSQRTIDQLLKDLGIE